MSTENGTTQQDNRRHQPDMTSRMDTLQELGHTPFLCPGTKGHFQLTTQVTGRSSLRHFVLGLQEINQYVETELVQVNQVSVKHWSHEAAVGCLQNHLSRIMEQDLKLTLRALDQKGQRHIVEVVITVICEDGLGDTARSAYEIIVRTVDKIVTTPDVTDVQFQSCNYVLIRHGAQTGFFLKEGSDHTMCMDVPPSENNEYIFKCYKFIGHNQEGKGGGEDAADGGFPVLCVLQQIHTGRFVAACPTSGRLKTDEDVGFRTNIQSITTPDCHFFILHQTGNSGVEVCCLRPLVMRNYYLRYDAIKGLKLKKCVPPPYKDFSRVRYFSFEFVPAQNTAD